MCRQAASRSTPPLIASLVVNLAVASAVSARLLTRTLKPRMGLVFTLPNPWEFTEASPGTRRDVVRAVGRPRDAAVGRPAAVAPTGRRVSGWWRARGRGGPASGHALWPAGRPAG